MASEEIANCLTYFWAREKNCNKNETIIDLRNLQSFASDEVHVVYDPMQFGTANIRMACTSVKRGEIVALVFSTGKVVIPGLESPSEAQIATDEIVHWMSSALGKALEARDVKTPTLVESF